MKRAENSRLYGRPPAIRQKPRFLPPPKLFRLLVFFSFVPCALWGNGDGNSQAENLKRVKDFLNTRFLDFEERPLLASFGGFSSSLHVRFPGPASGEEGEGTFVLAIPLDSNLAVETGLAFIDALESSKRNTETQSGGGVSNPGVLKPPQILVAFLGDEKVLMPGDIPSYGHKGLRDLLSLCEMPETWVICYLDAGEAPAEIVIRHGSGKYIAPLRLVKPLVPLLSGRGINSFFEVRYNEIYKLGLVGENDVLALAWGEEINGFCLSGARGKASGEKPVEAVDLADMLLEYQKTILFPLQNPDRHYSILSIPFPGIPPLFISEKGMVIFFVSFSAVLIFSFLVFSVVRRSCIIRNLKIFFRYSWIILILLPLLLVIIKGAGFVYSLLLLLFKTSPPAGDYFGIGCTVLLALVLFSLTAPLIKFFPIPGKAGFFGLSAVILVIPGVFIAMIMDFTFLPVFIWASCFTFLGALFQNPVLVFLFALLIPFQVLTAFFNIRETAGGKLAELLFSGWGGPAWITALQIAAPALPFALLLEKGIELVLSRIGEPRFSKSGAPEQPWLHNSPLKNSPVIRTALLGMVLCLMVIRILVVPSPPPPPERRSFTDTKGDILKISTENRIFEESRIIEITVEAKGDPLRFNLYLEGENPSPIYSSPAPFLRGDDGKSIEFILGENPPNPFKAEIVLPREFDISFRGEALYTQWDAALDKEDKPETEDYVFTVIRAAGLPASGNQE